MIMRHECGCVEYEHMNIHCKEHSKMTTIGEIKGGKMDRQEKWDRRFLALAKEVSTWSKDPSTKVGAVLVNDLNQVVGMGYNGFPRGVADDDRLNQREIKYELVVHAEVNATLQAGKEASGATLYVYPSFSLPPICSNCCKAVIQAGVAGIVGFNPDPNEPRAARWADSIAISRGMWEDTGKFIRSYDEKEG